MLNKWEKIIHIFFTYLNDKKLPQRALKPASGLVAEDSLPNMASLTTYGL